MTEPTPIDVKVKTLNSQTHDFSVQNNLTVRQFKEHIAETVNIQPDLQRIIYRGRILNDSVELKEYDMHGKVVHLVERPPPGPGGPENSNTDNPQPNTTTAPGRRRVFLHRGANGQPANAAVGTSGPALNLSSTLCLNRITVARHMLQCAQNIVNHMDNPSVPLDNAPMDLLVQETLDTTVVEVGISAISDVDQVQDIMHAFRGAVNAAFRPGGGGGVGADESEGNLDLNSSTGSSQSSSASSLSSSFDPADVIPETPPSADAEDQPPRAEGAAAGTGSTAEGSERQATTAEGGEAATRAAASEGTATSGASAANGRNQQQQTTSPSVLGEVVQEMRNVQSRLEPHLQRYYDILMNEPTYSAEETTRREDDQREFDRVSEALHYMSHAQHAISDLMLDLSTASPRHLCCRPILIEHSAFVNTGMPPPPGEILLAMGGVNIPAGAVGGAIPGGFQLNIPLNGDPPSAGPTGQPGAPGGGGSAPATPRRVPTQQPGAGRMTPHHHHVATIPILVQQTHNGMPTMEQLHQSAAAAAAAALNSNGIQELIQSIVSAAPMATIEVQRGNEPPITINVPPGGGAFAQAEQQQQPQGNETGSGGGGTAPGGRTTSATTMPTTSTQTRSTARPQVHVTSIQQPTEMRNPRPFPSSAFSAFDRFLPCNSHHVRDQQRRQAQQAAAAAGGNGAAAGGVAPGDAAPGGVGRENAMRIPHGRIEIPLGFPFQLRRRPTSVSNSRSASRERQSGTQTPQGGAASAAGRRSVTPSDDLEAVYNSQDPDEEFVMQTRDALQAFIVARFFNNAEITVENIKEGVSEIVIEMEELLAPISNYEHPDICIRLSVLELLRTHLQEILNLLRKDEEGDENAQAAEQRFGSNLIRSIRLLASRLSGILLQSNQRRQDIRQLFRAIFNRHLKELAPQPLGRLLKFAMKICLQTLDTKFGTSDTSALTPYLVFKSPSSEEESPMEVEESEVAATTAALQNQDVNMEAQPSTSAPAPQTTNTNSRPLLTRLRCESECEDYPEPTGAAAPWHTNVPAGWVATLASDVEEQKKINDSRAQPMSDAYLDGMTKKRRKTITDTRPAGSVAETISAGVREVIQSSGFQTTTPVDQIATQIASDVGLQSSYRESMNGTIRNRLRTDPNYDPKKYSNAEKYFK